MAVVDLDFSAPSHTLGNQPRLIIIICPPTLRCQERHRTEPAFEPLLGTFGPPGAGIFISDLRYPVFASGGITSLVTERAVYRIIGANLNRAREAIRVIEEFCRSTLNCRPLTERAKQFRHELSAAINKLDTGRLILS
jgi:hypothetical protein